MFNSQRTPAEAASLEEKSSEFEPVTLHTSVQNPSLLAFSSLPPPYPAKVHTMAISALVESKSAEEALQDGSALASAPQDVNALITKTIELMRGVSQLDISSSKSVLIIGQTGVGKSTLMNLLAGVRLKGVIKDPLIGNVVIDGFDGTTGFKIGHGVSSETTIPCRWKTTDADGDEVSYWDCPGFLANTGEAQEIADALFIKKLFDISKKTKILLMVSDGDIIETSAKNILSLINQLDCMFSGNIPKIKDSISLMVSKSPLNRTVSQVEGCIRRIIEQTPGLSESKKSILDILIKNPATILNVPIEGQNVDPDGLTKVNVLRKINEALKYSDDLPVNISLSDRTKIVTLSCYNRLHKIIQENTESFISDFREMMQKFSAECKNKDQLSSIILKLKDILTYSEKEEKSIKEATENFLKVANLFDKKINLIKISEASQLLEPFAFLEKFIDKNSSPRLGTIFNVMKKESTESIKILETRIASIEEAEQYAREIKAAQEAQAAAETQARKQKAAVERAEAERIAAQQLAAAEATRIAAETQAREQRAAAERVEAARIAAQKLAAAEAATKEAERLKKVLEDKMAQEARKREEEAKKEAERIRIEKEVREKAEKAVDPNELHDFLKLVVSGEQDKAEAMLKNKRGLGLVPVTFTDLSGRTFCNITGFQYAIWALDWHMWSMLNKHLEPKEAMEQVNAMKTGAWVSSYGEHANWQAVIDAKNKFLQQWYTGQYKATEFTWASTVGTAQRLLPVHVINEYCHPTRSFSPCPDFSKAEPTSSWRTRIVTFEGKNPGDWFNPNYTGRLGTNYAFTRGHTPTCNLGAGEWGSGCQFSVSIIRCDPPVLEELFRTRLNQRNALISSLTNNDRPKLKS